MRHHTIYWVIILITIASVALGSSVLAQNSTISCAIFSDDDLANLSVTERAKVQEAIKRCDARLSEERKKKKEALVSPEAGGYSDRRDMTSQGPPMGRAEYPSDKKYQSGYGKDAFQER